jgi:hypothetical protein
LITNPTLQRHLKESYTKKRKINKAMKIKERMNLTRCVDKQLRTRKDKMTEIAAYLSIINLMLMISIQSKETDLWKQDLTICCLQETHLKLKMKI